MPRFAWLFLIFFCGCPRPLPTPVTVPPPPPPPRPAPPPIRIPPGCETSLTGEWQHQDDPSFRYHFEDDLKEVTVWVYRVFPPPVVDAGSPSRLFPRVDAGTRDAGPAKVGKEVSRDAGPLKQGKEPRGRDAGVRDAGVRDAGVPDAGAPDAGWLESGVPDAGVLDAGLDAGPSDAGVDAGPADGDHHHPIPADLLPRDGGPAPLATSVIHLRRTTDGFVGEAEMLHLLPSGRECRATFATRVTACTPSTLTFSSATSTPVGEGCQTPASPQPAAMLEHRLARTDAGAL